MSSVLVKDNLQIKLVSIRMRRCMTRSKLMLWAVEVAAAGGDLPQGWCEIPGRCWTRQNSP